MKAGEALEILEHLDHWPLLGLVCFRACSNIVFRHVTYQEEGRIARFVAGLRPGLEAG